MKKSETLLDRDDLIACSNRLEREIVMITGLLGLMRALATRDTEHYGGLRADEKDGIEMLVCQQETLVQACYTSLHETIVRQPNTKEGR